MRDLKLDHYPIARLVAAAYAKGATEREAVLVAGCLIPVRRSLNMSIFSDDGPPYVCQADPVCAETPLSDSELDELERRLSVDEPQIREHTRSWALVAIRQLRSERLLPCECGCGKLVAGGRLEAAHPEDYRDERG